MESRNPLPDTAHEDALLDAALASYTEASPRPGIEQRILARVASEPQPRGHYWLNWRFGVAAAAMIVLLCLAIPLAVHQRTHPALPAPRLAAKTPEPPIAGPLLKQERQVASARSVPLLRRHARRVTVVSRPFVSPPLSREERLLLQLAALPHSPLLSLNPPAPIKVEPIQISAIQIKPLTSGSSLPN